MFPKIFYSLLAIFMYGQISSSQTPYLKNDNLFSSGITGLNEGFLAPNVPEEFSLPASPNKDMMSQVPTTSNLNFQEPFLSFGPTTWASSTFGISPSPVEIFVSEFNSAVYTSKLLPDIFDLRELSPEAFSKSMKDYVYARGVDISHRNPLDVASVVADPLKEGIDAFTLPIMLDIYGYSIAKYLFAKGTLTSSNASSLAKKYATTMEDTAKRSWIKEDPESKFLVLEDGYVDYMRSVGHFGLDTFEDLASQFAKEVKRIASKS